MPWSETQIAGHPCDVFVPSGDFPRGFAVLYLHGLELQRLTEKSAFTDEFERHRLPVLAPWTGKSWWTDRLCPEFDPAITAERHLLDHILPEAVSRFGAVPPGVALLGTGMGGQGALRIAFRHPSRFPVVAALSPAIDYWLRYREGEESLLSLYPDAESARQDSATLHVHPLNWPRNLWFCCDPADARWHESADRLHMKLAALGIPHEVDLQTTGGGHSFDYFNRMAPNAIGFLAERLLRESRRVL